MKSTYKFLLLTFLASCQGQAPSNPAFENRDADDSDSNNDPEDEDIVLEYKLSVGIGSASVEASGVVTSNPAGIDCGVDCFMSFDSATTLELTATAASGSAFVGWSDLANSNPTRTVIIDGIKSITAIFASGPQFIAEFAGTGRGTIASASNKFNCNNINLFKSGSCFVALSTVSSETFTATPAAGSTFGGWSESSCGNNPVCTVQITNQNSITATFVDTVTIPTNVAQLLNSACGACHNAGWNNVGALRLSKNDLDQRVTSGNMPPGRTLTTEEKNLITNFLDTL